MWKISFVASFLAAFLTMDDQLFDGATTRFAWRELNEAASATQAQVRRWARSPVKLAEFVPGPLKR
jgi:hypothetical protein